MRIEYFWLHEIQNPMEDQSIRKGDLVVLDRSLEVFEDGFFGVVIALTNIGIAAYTPDANIIQTSTEGVIKVRLIPMAQKWQGALLAHAIQNVVIVWPNPGS